MVGPGWHCDSCGWRKVRPGSSRHEQKDYHRRNAASAEQRRRSSEKFRQLLRAEAEEAERRAPELARLQAEEEGKARAREQAEALERKRSREEAARHAAERAAARRRAREKEAEARREAEREKREEEAAAERSRKEEAEQRRAEIDRRLLAGENAESVWRASLGGEGPTISVAQVKARQLELAKLQEHSGEPWAELAKDVEIERLVGQGVLRDVIKQQLGVGASRIARVRRRMWAQDVADRDRGVHESGPRRDRTDL